MLSEVSNEGGLLGNVREVDDDGDESTTDLMHNSQHSMQEAQIVHLARENAMLRQQHQQYQNSRMRPRASTQATFGMVNGGYSVTRGSVAEESEYAIDEQDEPGEGGAQPGLQRRMSEFGAGAYQTPYENRHIENVKKGPWQTSSRFGGDAGSRRHSFADVSHRQNSISSSGEPSTPRESTVVDHRPRDYPSAYPESAAFPGGRSCEHWSRC